MAVKKSSKTATEVKIETPVVETTAPEVDVEEATTETVDEQVEVEETEMPEVEIPEVEEPKADVEVDTKEVKSTGKPNGNVKIRMRADHRCTIAMVRYDLKAGKTYTVPENVKRILNKAGLLAPL